MTAPLPQTGDTRARLLDAAEEHYAARGIDAVSLREIGRHAGARNARAAQYWFTDRDGLLRAILDRHEPSVDAGRNALLDVYEAQGRTDVAGLADALVRPYAAKLGDGISGAGYLRVLADLLTQPRPSDAPWQDERFTSLRRWRRLSEPILDPDALALHRRFHTLRFVVVELAQRASIPGKSDHRLFVSQLVDATVGLLSAEPSALTRRLLAERDTR